MADFSKPVRYDYLWQNSKFANLAYSGSVISQFLNDKGYITLGDIPSSSGSISTGSLLTTASFLDPNLIFEKGDKTTFNVDISQLTVISASYAITASYATYAETASSATNAQDILIRVLNQSGYNIAKGLVVHITASGNSSDIPRIITASYENDANSANTLGITNEAIANGSQGFVMTEGILKGINTNAFQSGQLIYLGPTGSIVGYSPVAPLHNVRLGQVIRHQSNNGSIYVRIDNGYELEELHDVLITSASSGDLVVRSGSIWINSRQLTGSYDLTGSLNATSFTGSLYGTSSWANNALSVSNAISSSFATTASYAPNFANTDLTFTGNRVHGTNGNSLLISSDTSSIYSGQYLHFPTPLVGMGISITSSYIGVDYSYFWAYKNSSGVSLAAIYVDNTSSISTTNGMGGGITFINQNLLDHSFNVRGENDPNLLYAQASTDRIAIGKLNPNAKLDITGSVIITGSLTLTSPSSSIILATTSSAAPTWTGTDGQIVPATVGGQYYLYMWMNGAWRSSSFA